METLTPVHVGSGEMMDKLEYVILSDELCIVNYPSIIKLPKQRERLQRELYSLIKRDVNPSQSFNAYLEHLILERPEFILERFQITQNAQKALTSANAIGMGSITMIPKSGGSYYLPGSSIKGTIRTALIYSLMNVSVRSKYSREIMEIREEINSLSMDKSTHSAAWEKYKELSKKSKKIVENFAEFGDKTKNHFRHLRVNDISIPAESIYIEQILRRKRRPRPGDKDIPQYAQVLEIGSRVSGIVSFYCAGDRILNAAVVRNACNDFYLPLLERAGGSPPLSDAEKRTCFFLNIGKFSGASCKTFAGMRCINVWPPNSRRDRPFYLQDQSKSYNVPSDNKELPLGWCICSLEPIS